MMNRIDIKRLIHLNIQNKIKIINHNHHKKGIQAIHSIIHINIVDKGSTVILKYTENHGQKNWEIHLLLVL